MPYDLGLADRIRSTLLRQNVEFDERKMFGGIAFMVNEHMCCGVLKTDLVLRLTEEQVVAALKKPHTRPMDFSGKPMKAMIYVDPGGTDSERALESWVKAAVAVAQSAPKKPAKSPSKKPDKARTKKPGSA